MKILYGVNSSGQGHINRASIFIKELIKVGHDVHVLFAGRPPPDYACQLAQTTFFREAPQDFYRKQKVRIVKTLGTYLYKQPKFAQIRKEMLKIAVKENYDLFFTDVELYTAYVAKKIKKPCFNIDHQSSIFFPTAELPPGHYFEKFILKILAKVLTPHFSRNYTIDYTDKIERIGKVCRYPLIYKTEFDDYDITQDNHFVAYLPNADPEWIIRVFSKFTRETFRIYGFNFEKKISNIIFKKTNRTEFLKDLTSAKAIIGNAGFSLSWEACLTNKLIWMIPYKGQYEQIVNAYRLKKIDRAYYTKNITLKDFEGFKNWLEEKKYQPTTKLPILKADSILNDIYGYLDNYQSDIE